VVILLYPLLPERQVRSFMGRKTPLVPGPIEDRSKAKDKSLTSDGKDTWFKTFALDRGTIVEYRMFRKSDVLFTDEEIAADVVEKKKSPMNDMGIFIKEEYRAGETKATADERQRRFKMTPAEKAAEDAKYKEGVKKDESVNTKKQKTDTEKLSKAESSRASDPKWSTDRSATPNNVSDVIANQTTNQARYQSPDVTEGGPPTGAGTPPTQTDPCECPPAKNKDILNDNLSRSVFQNPVADQIGNAKGGFAAGLTKVSSMTTALAALGGNTSQLSALTTRIGNMQGVLDDYENSSNQLSGLPFTGGGPDMISLISSVGAAIKMQCALGIPGLDIGLGVGMVTENGKMQLNVAVDVQADLSRILDHISPPDGGSQTLEQMQSALDNAVADINSITNKMDEVAGSLNGMMDAANAMVTERGSPSGTATTTILTAIMKYSMTS